MSLPPPLMKIPSYKPCLNLIHSYNPNCCSANMTQKMLNPQTRNALLNLQIQNFLLTPPTRMLHQFHTHNFFPLHRRSTKIDVYRIRSLLTCPPPRVTKLLVFITCFLKYESGNLDFLQIFIPSCFFSPLNYEYSELECPRSCGSGL